MWCDSVSSGIGRYKLVIYSTRMALFCCSQVSLVGGLVLRMSVLAGNKARTGMVGLRTTRIRGQRVTRGRGPENRAPRARIARLTQIGGPCGIPVHPGDIPTPKGADRHPQPPREEQGPGPSRHRGPEAGGPGRPGPRAPGQPRPGITLPSSAGHTTSPGEVQAAGRPMAVRHLGQ